MESTEYLGNFLLNRCIVRFFAPSLETVLNSRRLFWIDSLESIFHRAVATTGVEELALVRGRADTASAVARKARTAALGLALVVLEHEQVVRSELEGRVVALQRLIRMVVAPRADTVARRQAHIVKRTDRSRIRRHGILQEVRRETLTADLALEAIDRQEIRNQQEDQSCDQYTCAHFC